MLDAYIIDAIRREEAERALVRENRIQLEIPTDRDTSERAPTPEMGDPIVIPLYPEDDAEDTAA